MAAPFWNHVCRLPRHPVRRGAEVVVEIQRGPEASGAVLRGELSDLSRNGLRLRVRQPLRRNEAMVVRIRDLRSALDLHLPATVKWQRTEDHRVWSVGCQFDSQLAWEEYGELFLRGILESEAPPGDGRTEPQP